MPKTVVPWLLAVSVVSVLSSHGAAPAAARDDCDGDVAILISPRAPGVGDHVRVLAATDAGPIGDLLVTDAADTAVAVESVQRLGGPPWSATTAFTATAAGPYRVQATRGAGGAGCVRVAIAGAAARGGTAQEAASRTAWDGGSEALYSAWIERLFAAPPDQSLSFDKLQDVLGDPERNLLHDHLGLGEDDAPGALGDPPDCADLPYVLRTYFASKTGLPVGFRKCSRGSASEPPRCGPGKVVIPPDGSERRGWFGRVAREAMDTVHSGSARTALADDATDFYPVALTRAALRPGTVYADPYGHTLMIVEWVPPSGDRGGMLLAVDAQPDNSVARKRFWEGTFLFADDVPGAGPGFKALRPLVAAGRGAPAPLSNAALGASSGFAPFSLEQTRLTPEEFYVRIGHLIDPDGLRPLQAYEAMLAALVEQLETRVDSVQRGEDWVRAHPGTTVDMPEGAGIFETIGPWEDYATPSRDLRLLIAMRVLLDLPARIERHPELYVLDEQPPSVARAAVEERHARAIDEKTISYVRSDGSPWRLSLAELLDRRPALETAYDPNDCVEVRWGAPRNSDEAATCRRRAPVDQRTRMEQYRDWFHEGRRPSR
jgi:hypothetical protein